MTELQKKALSEVAKALEVDVLDLFNLINFESSWNPQAENPLSSAKGLLQFTDSTAQWLGYKNSLDLITKNKTIESQLYFPVLQYLTKYKPFQTKQSLYMSVFYPAARYWLPTKHFPDSVKKVNPGITTVQSYIDKVDKTKKKIPFEIISLIAIGLYLLMMKG